MQSVSFAHNLPLTDEELRGIGLVAQQWALFEGLLTKTIAGIFDISQEKGALIGTAMAARLTIELATAASSRFITDETDQKAFSKLMERAGKLHGERNDAVHLIWNRHTLFPDRLEPIGLKVRSQIKPAQGEMTVAGFEAIAQKIYQLTIDLAKFLAERRLWNPISDETNDGRFPRLNLPK